MLTAPILSIVIPLIASFLVVLLRLVRPKVDISKSCGIISIIATSISFVLLLNLLPTVWRGGMITYSLGNWPPPLGISLAVDGLSAFVALTGSFISLMAIIYSLAYKEYEARYYSLLLLLIAGMLGVILTGDIFNMYVFFELLSVASIGLIALGGEEKALTASLNYLFISSVGVLFFLMGIGLLYGYTGTLNLAHLSEKLPPIFEIQPAKIVLPISLLLTGAAIKSALIPLHVWLPDAHSYAPSPISAILSGFMVKVGIYMIIRISYLLQGSLSFRDVYLWMGGISALGGVLIALTQYDIKRILAFHTISQLGYISLAWGVGTSWARSASILHLFNHALFKSSLFLCAGSVIYITDLRDVREIRGLGRRTPILAAACIVASLSISGIPLFNGFVSKSLISYSLNEDLLGKIVITLAGIGTVASFFKLNQIFFGRTRGEIKRKISYWMYIPMLFLALLCILFGIFPHLGLRLVVNSILEEGSKIMKFDFWKLDKLIDVMITLVLGFGLFKLVTTKLKGITLRLSKIEINLSTGLMLIVLYLIGIILIFNLGN